MKKSDAPALRELVDTTANGDIMPTHNVTVQLTGNDGNAFYIIGAISTAPR